MVLLLFQREIIYLQALSFAGMFVCHNYNTLSRSNASCWLIFNGLLPKPKLGQSEREGACRVRGVGGCVS